jgi:uncharacterized protein
VIARLPAVLACALICGRAGQTAAQQTTTPQAAATISTAAASVGNIDVRPRPDALTITIAVCAPVAPTSSRAFSPDRVIFDFPGCELKGGNRHIPVNNGPVRELRMSLFSAHPPATRVVVESTEPLNFELKPSTNGTVAVEISFPKTKSAASVANSPTTEKDRVASIPPPPKEGTPPKQSQVQKPPESRKQVESPQPERKIARRSATAPPGAYALMEKAKALSLEDLQPLEDKAKAGNPEAQTLLALAYHAGVLLRKDDVEATRLLHQAADRGYMAAEESLGIFSETGIGMEGGRPAPADALNWYKKAAQQGSIDAATDIALLYANGKGVTRDSEQAVAWFRRAAEGGDASAQYNLALMYERGEGAPRDYKEAIRWLTAAGDQDLIPPLLALAEISLQPPNSTMTADVNKAMQYYERAANLGSAVAEVALGTIFSKGLQGKVDYDQAVGWYKKAADKGEPDGEFALGVSYAMGHGVPVDYTLARRWLGAAASQGQMEAQYDLAIICEEGDGAAPDRKLAAHYYQMAADRGMAKAQYRFGLLLAKSSPSSNDKIAAYKWLMLAQESVKESSQALSDVKKSLSPQEITQAEQEVTNWRSTHGPNKR